MQTRTIAYVTILIAVLTIIVALFAVTYGTQSSTIVLDGKVYLHTANGTRELKDVEYLGNAEPFVAPIAINIVAPATLPNTAAPHGTYTCTLVDNNGNSYDVSTDDTCDTLN